MTSAKVCPCAGCQSRARATEQRPQEHLVPMLVRIPPEVADELRALSRRTRVPLATYQREAMADLVAKYRTRRTSEES